MVVQNKNIGHSLIPEVRDLYEAWVQFTVKDASGAKIYESGFFKPDGMLDERAHSFTNRPVERDRRTLWTTTRSGRFIPWPMTTRSRPGVRHWCATSFRFRRT